VSFFGNPAILDEDPWLCVTGLLRFCYFSKITRKTYP